MLLNKDVAAISKDWRTSRDIAATLGCEDTDYSQGRKFMSCSHRQELGQQASRLLIGCTKVNNQSEAWTASHDLTLDNGYNS